MWVKSSSERSPLSKVIEGLIVTGGIANLFGNAGTWFTLLSVVIIILAIGVVIYAVNRFGGSRGSMSGDEGL